MARVSIVVPTYNNARFLQETLESIYRQDYRDFEVVVVDDGSTDDTKLVLEPHRGKINYLYQENSGGCSKPRNVGIAAATGEYISIFDSDDIMVPEKIRLQAQFLDAYPEVGFVFTDFCDFRGKVVAQNHVATCPIFNALNRRYLGQGRYLIRKEDALETLVQENFIGASSMMFRKSLYEDIGPFDEGLDSSEDLDFTFRVSKKYDLGFVDNVCHLRRLHEGSMSARTEKVITRMIKVYSRQLQAETSPSIAGPLKDKIANLYMALGYYYRLNEMFRESVASYLKSILTRSLPNNSYVGLLKSMGSWLFRLQQDVRDPESLRRAGNK